MSTSTGSAFDPQQALSQHALNNFYIGGDWVKPQSDRKLDLISPVTEECFLSVPEASEKDVNRAVGAAREAFDHGPWPRMTAQERSKFVLAIGEEMKKRAPLLTDVWTAQVGAPKSFAGYIINFAPQLFEFYGQLGARSEFAETRDMMNGGKALVIREPVGVVAIITPWNAPMVLMSYGVAAALTAGCTIVAKPAPETPIEGQLLAECAEAIGLPPGVLNIVPAGREVGDYLINRPEIDKVSFTGSVAGGKRIAEVCAKRLARYTLELGGKSPAVIMDDADLSNAIGTIVPFAMPMTGQICFSLTRVLVSKKRHDEVVDAYSQAVKKIVVGDPWKADTQMGPLSMKRQLDRVMGYIEKGRKEGAKIVTGGGRPKEMNRGYFVEPTIFSNVDSDMTIAKEEIFGPVVSVMPYENEEDAIRIANSSSYGLSGAVFTNDPDKGLALARRIRTGNVTINGLKLDNAVPFGGYKESGVGRVGGPEGLEAYQEIKSVYLPG
jgi:acyl-CoA reductase-like NAD-dependent aldehyde dehydrogenase